MPAGRDPKTFSPLDLLASLAKSFNRFTIFLAT